MQDRRLVINVRGEDRERLEARALRSIRPLRDEAAWLLHWALVELERRESGAAVEQPSSSEAAA